jgi:hypothetical protein
MPLQRCTIGVGLALLWFSLTSGPVCSAKDSLNLRPILHLVDQIMFCVFPHISEQYSQHIAILISKQVVPYRTRCGIYCPGVMDLRLEFKSRGAHRCEEQWNVKDMRV